MSHAHIAVAVWIIVGVIAYVFSCHIAYRIFELKGMTFGRKPEDADGIEGARCERAAFWPVWLCAVGFVHLSMGIFYVGYGVFGIAPRWLLVQFPRKVELFFQKKQRVPDKGPFRNEPNTGPQPVSKKE